MASQVTIVAGGAGFIGSHLCERLISVGRKVIALDDLSTGNIENLSNIINHPYFHFVYHDITEKWETAESVGEIFNLACPASPKQYQKDPIKTYLTSSLGSKNLLDLATEKRARILLASTSEVYGDPLQTPQRECYWGNVNTTGDRSCYDEGKRGAETLFHCYHKSKGTDIRIIRIFNTYGPRMSSEDGRVIPNFIIQALFGKALTINGTGVQTRSFMYVSDLVNAILNIMQDGMPSFPVNIGNPHEISINQLADIIVRLTNSTSSMHFNPLPMDDPKRRCPDIDRARAYLNGWRPSVQLEEGLNLTISYFNQQIHKLTNHESFVY